MAQRTGKREMVKATLAITMPIVLWRDALGGDRASLRKHGPA